jgi:hypothetical protein
MNILFWLNGSGGQRTEREIMEFPHITPEILKENKFGNPVGEIEDALDQWKYDIRCGSQYIRWGWDDNFDPITKEPLSKEA